MLPSDRLFIEILRSQGLLPPEALEAALGRWEREGGGMPLGAYLLQSRLLGAEAFLAVNQRVQGFGVGCPSCGKVYTLQQFFPSLERSGKGHYTARCPGCQAMVEPGGLLLGIEPKEGGNLAFGRFEVIEEIGRGGMGVVYRALDRQSGHQVALKILLSGANATAQHIGRFRREIDAAGRLDHPCIVKLLGSGEGDGVLFMAMEFISGASFAEAMPKMNLEERLEVILGVAEAMDYAHSEGLLHRDLKPENVLVDEAGEPHVADFGLAKDVAEEDSRLTRTGMMLGTPFYMAPEAILHGAKAGSERSDIWSLGIMLYEALAGELPFKADTVTTLYRAICQEDPPYRNVRGEEIPAALWGVCRHALARNPESRLASMFEFRQALEEAALGRRGIPRAALVVGAVAVGLLVVLTFAILFRHKTPPRETGAAAHPPGDVPAVPVQTPAGGPGDIEAQIRAGMIEKAQQAILEMDPSDPAFDRLAGLLLEASGRHAEAIPRLDAAVARDPTDAGSLRSRLKSLIELGRLDDANRDVQLLLGLDGGSASTWLLAGLLRIERREDADARDALERAITLDPRLVDAHLALGELDLESREMGLARARFERAGEIAPQDPRPLASLAIVLAETGEPQAASTRVERALALAPDFAQAYRARSIVNHFLKRPESALRDAKRAVELDGKDGRNWFQLGRESFLAKDVDGAKAAFRRAEEIRPAFVEVSLWMARCHLVEKDHGEVIRRLDGLPEKLRAKRNRLDAWRMLAIAHDRQEEPKKAIKAIRNVTREGGAQEEDLDLHFKLTLTLRAFPEGGQVLARYEQVAPSSRRLRVHKTVYLASDANPEHDYQAALSLAEAALTQPDCDVVERDLRAHCLWRLGKLDEAISAQREALAHAPEDLDPAYRRIMEKRMEELQIEKKRRTEWED